MVARFHLAFVVEGRTSSALAAIIGQLSASVLIVEL